jgi:putative NIF3 family GTP cyclohydrolase 1 type 2
MTNAVRAIGLSVALAGVVRLQAAEGKLTAAQVIDRIKAHVGVSWQSQTVDTFKAGNPDTPVTGIATTFAATVDVLQRAAASGKNLIIAHEPTFYNHLDRTDELKNDPVYQAKRQFIEQHGLVVFRFHDHWHQHKPDGILTGMVAALGWGDYQDKTTPDMFRHPGVTLNQLAEELKRKLNIRTIRVVGAPDMNVTGIAFLPGASGSEQQIEALERQDVQVLVAGESREWETVEYVRDAAAEGKKKALILLGHVPSEEAGMKYCAEWLKTFLPEVPVEYIPAGEPFWTPQ